MKLKALSLSMLAALFTGCSSDIADGSDGNHNQESPEAIRATIEPAQMDAASRATFAADASFIWTAGDRIGVSLTNGSTTLFSTFMLSKGTGTTKGTFIGSISSGYTIGNKLVYPKSIASSLSGSTLTINLPAEYDYAYPTESFGTTTGDVNSANMPMMANYAGSGVEFKHLGGYFVFEISKIPAGCNKFEFEAVNNKKISGTFTVDTSASEPSYNTSTSVSEKKITINFPETTSECKRLFIVPVPVGSYEYEWNIYDTNGCIRGFGASDGAISVSRGQIKAKRLDCANISTGDDTGGSTANMVNGHEYVDLGLPSGLKWATCNVGANKPEEYGDYFAWGETIPQSNNRYYLDSYKWCKGSISTMTKYCTQSAFGIVDNKTTLDLSDDAASANWGGTWRMPTRVEQDELRTKCTWTWTTLNGIYGHKVTGPNGNCIFLPASGYRASSSLYDVGTYGGFWSSSLVTGNSSHAYYFSFNFNNVDWFYNYGRFYGQSVRAVCDDDSGNSAANMVNSHEYVNLGLSVKWATCNVGASLPEEYGDYYAWGETVPKSNFDWSTYKWCNGSFSTMTKYCTKSSYGTVDDKTTIDLSDDAAHVNWGGTWRIPTKTEQDELRTKCTWTWTTLNGVNGYKVTSEVNGNFIFLPAAGYRYMGSLFDAGSDGSYWSSSLYGSNSSYAYSLSFDLRDVYSNSDFRRCGQSVRAVCP